jgi:hypothetical protein
VTVNGGDDKKIKVSYTARWRGRLLTHEQRTIALRHGAATTVFVLSQTAARTAKITVTARANGQAAVSSTLKRTMAH